MSKTRSIIWILLLSTGTAMMHSPIYAMCGPKKKKHQTEVKMDIAGKAWKLQSILMKERLETVKEHAPTLTLNKTANKASGNGGCNTYNAAYTIAGNSITFSEVASTRMFCEGTMELEKAFFSGLKEADHWEYKNDLLLMKHGDETILTFGL